MKSLVVLIINLMSFSVLSQKTVKKIEFSKEQYEAYHLNEHLLCDTVMLYYSQFWQNTDSLNMNQTQRAASVFGIYDQLSSKQEIKLSLVRINNFIFNLALPTYEKYNCLEMVEVLNNLKVIYQNNIDSFIAGKIPPSLDPNSDQFKSELNDKLDIYEAMIIDYSYPNNLSFYIQFVKENLSDLVAIKE
jgi:hypothetical protein